MNVSTRQTGRAWTLRVRRHLREPQLAAAALQFLNGEALDLSASDEVHLGQCARCAARLDALRETLAGERHAAVDAVDERFSDARLGAQRRSILARLGRREPGARVLRFPAIAEPVSRRERPAMRWLAAAAAAGLFVGLAASPIVYPDVQRFPRGAFGSARYVAAGDKWWLPSISATSSPSRIAPETDELFLSEMESALNKRRIPALRALDDLTPRTHDLVTRRRR